MSRLIIQKLHKLKTVKKSKDDQYSSDNLLDKQVKTEDAKQADIENLERDNATPVDPAMLNTSKPNVQSVEAPER